MKLSFSIFLLFIIYSLSSCCTKKNCDESIGMNTIEFYNFNKTDLDTIKIYSYSKNSYLTVFIDSFTTNNRSNIPDYDYVYTNKSVSDYDFKIIISKTGQIFNLTDVNTEKKGCNSCFPYRPKSDYYKPRLRIRKLKREIIFFRIIPQS